MQTTCKPEFFSALIPFSGFYDSIHTEAVVGEEERFFTHSNGEKMPELLDDKFLSSCDYRSVFEEYAQDYVQRIANELEIEIEWEEMTSPREYNFQTDRLFGKINRKDLAKMLRVVRGKKLNKKVKEKSTSRSGFTSFYSNDVSSWGPISTWDHNQIGAVVEAYLEVVNKDECKDCEWEAMDAIQNDGLISDWLYLNAGDWGKWAIRTADFLRNFRDTRPLKAAAWAR